MKINVDYLFHGGIPMRISLKTTPARTSSPWCEIEQIDFKPADIADGGH
jgi:hypothetical protein